MKLIDRDKFINDMFDLYLDAGWNPQDVHFSLLDVRSNIDSPEYEVEAIPIEFIKEYIDKSWRISSHSVPKTEQFYIQMAKNVKSLLNEWEILGNEWQRNKEAKDEQVSSDN